MLKAVLFDMGETLVTGFRDGDLDTIVAETAAAHPAARETLNGALRIFRAQRAEDLRALTQRTFRGAAVEAFVAEVRTKREAGASNPLAFLPPAEFDAALETLWERISCDVRAYPETIDTLDMLSTRGLILGLVSNVSFDWWKHREVLDSLGIARYFSVIVWSAAHGMRKPHPSIFRYALHRLRVDAQNSIFVGDSLEKDVAGAKAVGMRAVWINRSGDPSDSRITPPNWTIADLSELVTIVETLNGCPTQRTEKRRRNDRRGT